LKACFNKANITEMGNFDVVVIGLGGWGSSALYHCAKAGAKVCGIEQFQLNHDKGSSHGDSRVIRMAYFMHPDYVPVLRRAYDLWRKLEEEAKTSLLTVTGLLCVGEPNGDFIQGLESCYQLHALPHERLSSLEAQKRFPQFKLPDEAVCYFDSLGGYLRPEASVRTHVELANRLGAVTFFGERLISWKKEAGHVLIRTDQREICAEKLIITTGAFTSQPGIETPIRIQALRKVLFWYSVKDPTRFCSPDFPVWIAKLGGLNYYGFPSLEPGVIKAAEDTGGQPLQDPYMADPGLRLEDESNLRLFLDKFLKQQVGARLNHKVCLYENSPDRHFVIDRHPEHVNVILAVGGSGHGFKFATVAGEMAADLALTGRSKVRPEIFRLTNDRKTI
jgi:sarcosine oxidase